MNDQAAAARAPRISFEFFPPKTPAATLNLWRSVERLAPLGPEFVSVTYGAGGTTRERTLGAIAAIRERARLDVAGHLTCVGATREETLAVARAYRAAGCARIVALRGDPPKDAGRFTPHPDGFASSLDLIEALARVKDSFNSYPLDRFAIAGAAAAIEDRAYFEDTCRKVIATRTRMVADLESLGFEVLPSAANFVFARHDRHEGAELAARLRERSIIVRHFKNPPRIAPFLRITVGTDGQCEALVGALREILAE